MQNPNALLPKIRTRMAPLSSPVNMMLDASSMKPTVFTSDFSSRNERFALNATGMRIVRSLHSRSNTYRQPSLEPPIMCRSQPEKATEKMQNRGVNGCMLRLWMSFESPLMDDNCTVNGNRRLFDNSTSKKMQADTHNTSTTSSTQTHRRAN